MSVKHVALFCILVPLIIVGSLWLFSDTAAVRRPESTISRLYWVRITLVLLVWALCWDRIAIWVSRRISVDASVIIGLKVRVLLWVALFEIVLLIGVLL